MRLFVLVLLALCAPFSVFAASLSVAPSSSSASVGDTVTLSVFVDSQGTAVNNAEGSLVFPKGLFDVVSVNQNASLFSLWIQAPAYDGNNAINFNGGLPSPGYSGSAGRLFSVTLRAKAAGSGTVSILNGAVRANDGLGTDVMSAAFGSVVSVSDTTAQPAQTAPAPANPAPTETSGAPEGALTVTSPTNPSQDAWYSSPTAVLKWTLPGDVTAVETLLSDTKGEKPTVLYSPAIATKTIDDLDEGVRYFNVRAKNASGWGPVTSYKLQIDKTPPVLSKLGIAYEPKSKSLVLSADVANAVPNTVGLQGAARDDLSGIASLAVMVDGTKVADVSSDKMTGTTYTVPLTLTVGSHSASVTAVDKAGNKAESAPTAFEVIAEPSLYETVAGWFRGFDVGWLLVIVTLAVSLASIIISVMLWRQVKSYEEGERAPRVMTRTRRAAHERLIALKRGLQRERKYFWTMRTEGEVTREDAQYLHRIEKKLAELEQYLGSEAQDGGAGGDE